uniref:Major facilitator superfamily (MFS) profile domain-containing protein n=1 Tax=Acrobeloides nanus TaxID=290746 RepID=A0A914EQE4_9BILA
MLAPQGNPKCLVALFGLLAILTNFQDSYSNSYANTAYNGFRNFFNDSYIERGSPHGLSKWSFTFLWSFFLNIWTFGFLAGTFITPYLTDNYGRKMALILSAMVSLLGTSLSVIAVLVKSPEFLLVARTIASSSSGVSFNTLVVFIQEAVPTNVRGTCSFLIETSFLFINVFGFAFGLDVILGHYIDLLIGVGLIPGILALLIMFPLKETPKFLLIHKNDNKAALEALIFYQGERSNPKKQLETMLLEAKEDKIDIPLKKALIKVIKVGHLRKALLLGILSIQLIIPVWTMLYLSSLLLEAHFSAKVSQYTSFAYIVLECSAGIVGASIVENFGRKRMLLTSAVVNTLAIVAYIAFDRLAFYYGGWFKYGCIGSLFSYGITYGAALGPISVFISTELTPQKYRSIIQSTVLAVNTIMQFIITFSVLPLYNLLDIWAFIPLFVIPAIFCISYIAHAMPETKGREIYEIVAELRGNDSSTTLSTLSSEAISEQEEDKKDIADLKL